MNELNQDAIAEIVEEMGVKDGNDPTLVKPKVPTKLIGRGSGQPGNRRPQNAPHPATVPGRFNK